MEITLGQFSLRLTRQNASANTASANDNMAAAMPILLEPSQARSPYLYNRYDAPHQNLNFIRETVAACMHARSEAISRGRLRARLRSNTWGPDGSRTESPQSLPSTHPLHRLLERPNPLLDLSDMLELSSQWLDATGNSLWLKIRNGDTRRNPLGEVTELWPIAAIHYLIERQEDQMPSTYWFTQTNTRIPASDIIHIRRSDIRTSPFNGHAILSDMLETAKADSAVRLFQSRFFENDATPRTVLSWPSGTTLSQAQMDAYRDAWDNKYGGPANAGRVAMLGDGGQISTIGAGAKELDFGRSKKELRDSIRESFKVPQIVLGDVDGVNLSNADSSYMVFMRDVVDYALAKHARALTRGLASEFELPNSNGRNTGGSIEIIHEPIIPESETQFMTRLGELKQSLTVDEQRALLALPPLPNNRGSVFLLGTQVMSEDWSPL